MNVDFVLVSVEHVLHVVGLWIVAVEAGEGVPERAEGSHQAGDRSAGVGVSDDWRNEVVFVSSAGERRTAVGSSIEDEGESLENSLHVLGLKKKDEKMLHFVNFRHFLGIVILENIFSYQKLPFCK